MRRPVDLSCHVLFKSVVVLLMGIVMLIMM